MPGVIMTEDASQNGALANRDRDRGPNGSFGTGDVSASGKMQTLDSAKASGLANGDKAEKGEVRPPAATDPHVHTLAKRPRMNDLPDEIVHIAEGYIPLSLILSRLAQQTHSAIQDKVQQLARMPLPPPPASTVNGNSSAAKDKDEFDNSQESLSKKVNLLQLIQTIHGKWVKALVIANWSRESEMVTKLIDIKSHINEQLLHFDMRLDQIIDLKRNLIFARVPSPDLKTALQVLSCGNGDWMPDLGYIEPPTLSLRDHAKWLEDLDTCLSIRLNLHDFDKIPRHFRNYSIGSGRATFTVKGEFEVDLTVADDDPEKQFWFIDIRFDFLPAAGKLSDHFKPMLEAHVNNALAQDGLAGCYDLLHEFVLSHKVNELRRQAYELGRTSWANTIAVEPLDRAVSIQYWLTRQPQNTSSVPTFSKYVVPVVPSTLKSWIIISVNSGLKPDGNSSPNATSHLTASWYRDGKLAKDVEIQFDHDNLSTEKLLKSVIAKHVDYILTSVHKKLRPAPRFANQESCMDLHISPSEPGDSYLTMQLGPTDFVTLKMEPTTGRFTLNPHSKYSLQGEHRLNNSGKDPSEDGAACLENLRWHHLTEEVTRKGRALGWTHVKSPLSHDDVRSRFKPQDVFHPVCFQRQGIDASWYVMLVMSLQGDEWWAFQAPGPKPSVRTLKHFAKLRFDTGQPGLGPDFWNNLTTFVTGVVTHAADLQEIHAGNFLHVERPSKDGTLSNQVVVPSIFVKLSDILPTAAGVPWNMAESGGQQPTTPGNKEAARDALSLLVQEPRSDGGGPRRTKPLPHTGPSGGRKPWAHDFVELKYCGVQSLSRKPGARERRLTYSMDAVIRVADKQKFSLLTTRLGQDILYNPRRGELCIRLRENVGVSVVQMLKTRLQAIDRVVDSLDSMARAKHTVKCEKVTLEKVVFTYTDGSPRSEGAEQKRWRATLDLSKPRVAVLLEDGNPHLRAVGLLTRLGNGPGGIRALTIILPLTLPILTTLDRIHSTWRDLTRAGKGSLTIQQKALDWIILSYDLGPLASRPPRTLCFDIRARLRDGALWWHVFRSDKSAGADPAPDYFDQRLRKVWEARNMPWRALGSGAATHVDDRALKLLLGLDQTVREAILAAPAPGPGPGSGSGPGPAPAGDQGFNPAGVQGVVGNAQGAAGRGGPAQGQQAAMGSSRSKPVTLD